MTKLVEKDATHIIEEADIRHPPMYTENGPPQTLTPDTARQGPLGVPVLWVLIGIVKKNGIMLVDFAMTAEREQNLSSHDAIRQAALLRFRPILMTTFAAILGGVPLMLGHGTGSEIRQPLGYSMVGGLIVSQALTLFTTPVIYLYLDRVQQWLSGKKEHPSRVNAIHDAGNAMPMPAGE